MSEAVRKMFASIAYRYDLANDVLSFGIHRYWRRKAVRALNLKAGDTVLDLCTGTGDFALEVERQMKGTAKIIGIDFVAQMLELAREKSKHCGSSAPLFIQGDAMELGIKPKSIQAATIGFGIRNVDDPGKCLLGLKNTLDSQGRIAILEFGQPENKLFAAVYWFYASYILPFIGSLLTGNREAYEYLPRTSKSFPCGKDFADLLRTSGFVEAEARPLFGGIAWLYTAKA